MDENRSVKWHDCLNMSYTQAFKKMTNKLTWSTLYTCCVWYQAQLLRTFFDHIITFHWCQNTRYRAKHKKYIQSISRIDFIYKNLTKFVFVYKMHKIWWNHSSSNSHNSHPRKKSWNRIRRTRRTDRIYFPLMNKRIYIIIEAEFTPNSWYYTMFLYRIRRNCRFYILYME